MRLVLKLKWVEATQKWHLLNPATGKFIYDLFDCENMNRIFNYPDKNEEKLYVIDVHKFCEEDKRKIEKL